jgi:plastocyanin
VVTIRALLAPLATALALTLVLPACSNNNNSYTPTTPPPTAELSSGNLAPGMVYQHTFANAGTYPYHCTIHAAMTGNQVVVDAGSAVDSAVVNIVSMTAPGFSPSSVTIKPGGRVRWINTHTTTHTVTSGS